MKQSKIHRIRLVLFSMTLLVVATATWVGAEEELPAPPPDHPVDWHAHPAAKQGPSDSGERNGAPRREQASSVVTVRDLPTEDVRPDPTKNFHVQGEMFQADVESEGADPAAQPQLFSSENPGSVDGRGARGVQQRSWDGLDMTDTGGWRPPDVQLAVGDTHVVEATNSGMRIWRKSDNAVTSSYWSFSSFFANVLPVGWQGSIFDPRIVWQNNEFQYVMVLDGSDSTNQNSYWFLAVSQTSDPNGSWWVWRLSANWTGGGGADSDSWADYPMLSADDWGVYITGNLFLWSGNYKYSTLNVVGPGVYTGGSTAGWGFWDLQWPANSPGGNAQVFSLAPAQFHTTAGGNETFMITSRNGGGRDVLLYTLTGDRSNSPGFASAAIQTKQYYWLGENVNQPGSSIDLDGGGAAIENAVYSNRNLWAVLTNDNSNAGTSSSSYVLKLNVDNATRVADTFYNLCGYQTYPSLTVGGTSTNSNVALTYSYIANAADCTSDFFPSATWGIMTPDLQTNLDATIMFSGVGPYVNRFGGPPLRNRWGDYSGAQYDFVNSTAWLASEYATGGGSPASDTSVWGTRVVEADISFTGTSSSSSTTSSTTTSTSSIPTTTTSTIATTSTTIATTSTTTTTVPACTDDGFETGGSGGSDDGCWGSGIGFASPQTHALCDEDWVTFLSVTGNTYRIETTNLTGGADTVLEITYNCGAVIVSDDNSGPGAASFIEWTADDSTNVDVRIIDAASYGNGKGYDITVTNLTLFYDGFETGTTGAWSSSVGKIFTAPGKDLPAPKQPKPRTRTERSSNR